MKNAQATPPYAPYYQDEFITVYNADSQEFLKHLNDNEFDLLLTDPPYGINMSKGAGGRRRDHIDVQNWDAEIPSGDVFANMIRASREQIIWGGNYFTDHLPASMGWLVWDKGQREFSLADGELAWTSFWKAMRIKMLSRSEAMKDGKIHPTQKSIAVMKWCIKYAQRNPKKEIKRVLDPFGGSLTTAVACKELNIECVSIEREEKYCAEGVKRLYQGVFELDC